MKLSDIKRQTPTLPQQCIKILSSCTVVQWFIILTFSDILVQSKIGFSDGDFLQRIYTVIVSTATKTFAKIEH